MAIPREALKEITIGLVKGVEESLHKEIPEIKDLEALEKDGEEIVTHIE